MQPLPLGRSSFSTLRAKNEIYVDKTDWIYQLTRFDTKALLIRPRRFGKSLLISTFESLFENGLKDFHGLAIETLWTDRTYPVVRLDFSGLKTFKSSEQFEAAFKSFILASFTKVGFRYEPKKPIVFLDQFKMWLNSLSSSALVILIDEYDAPLTANLDDKTAFEEIRNTLSDFYAAIKEYEGKIRFFFMTGITKISNTGIFSAFNNLQDISMDPLYGTLIGYTQKEILHYFKDYLQRAAQALNLSIPTVMERLQQNYDGFCFDENAQSHVYCPWSVLNFFNRPERGFQNYWYASGGQPAALMKYLASRTLAKPISYSETKEVRLSELSAARQYDDIGLEALLTQAGYLTIKETTTDQYAILGYPNFEVAVSMAQLYADELLAGKQLRQPGSTLITNVLAKGTSDELVEQFNGVVNAIDYVKYPIVDEASLRAYIQVLLIGAAMIPQVEVHSALGRSDMEVCAGNRHWVLEFKYASTDSEVNRLLREGIEQVHNRHYGVTTDQQDLKRLVLVFNAPKRSFTAWKDC